MGTNKKHEKCPKGCRGKLMYFHSDNKHIICSCGAKWNKITNNLVVNNFSIERCTNSDGKFLPSNFMQWQAKHLFSDTLFLGNKKKECILWAENFVYENE